LELELFDFELPADRVAQEPLADRSAARLLRLFRATGAIEHHAVGDLPALLRPGDLMVFNNTAVVPAKLVLRRASGGRVVGLFLREIETQAPWPPGPGMGGQPRLAGQLRWLVLLNSKGRLRAGETLAAEADPAVRLVIDRRVEQGQWEVVVRYELAPGEHTSTIDLLRRIGQTPLPPYIHRQGERADDRARYQTVFASRPGAVAAPTAGLHFTPMLLEELTRAGVEQANVTLHVGLGTFEPVREQHVELHRMHSEWFECPAATADAVNSARLAGRRVVAVGTTSVRVLESCVGESPGPPFRLRPRTGWTDIFIYPGYRFGVVDAMLTNFHLPRSTLLMLVSAFAGRERIMSAYREAIDRGYRFFSYGDAMLIE